MRADADAVRLNAGIHKYCSVPLFVSSLGFFSPHVAAGTWTDAELLLAGADAQPRPLLRHMTAADFLTLLLQRYKCE